MLLGSKCLESQIFFPPGITFVSKAMWAAPTKDLPNQKCQKPFGGYIPDNDRAEMLIKDNNVSVLKAVMSPRAASSVVSTNVQWF